MNIKTSITSLHYWQKVFANTSRIGVKVDDDDETRLHKLIMVITSLTISVAAIIWGIIYIYFDEINAGLIPIFYAITTFLSLLILRFYNIYSIFKFSQILLILLLPFLLMISLGGFVNGSAVIIWGFFAPIAALLSGQAKVSIYWFLSFVILVIISAFIQPYLRPENNLPDTIKIIFFAINIGTVSFVNFLVLKNFVSKKENIIELMRQNRELERIYLQQEVALRESDKLATLGRLSAGMAHELNNPAAASLRGSKQLNDILLTIENLLIQFGQMNLSNQHIDIIKVYYDKIVFYSKKSIEIEPLDKSDRENELEIWLENRDIKNPWDIASFMVSIDVAEKELLDFTKDFNNEQLSAIFSALHCIYTAHNLLEEIGHGTERISEIVKSLKSYSHMDQGPIQSIDIHEGINDTLVMLRSELKKGITVEKKFDYTLPHIQAYGSELNQVWTNIIDNAIGAMNGKGKLSIETFREEEWVVVQFKNNGPEIPKEIQRKVFDPFFTTKSPGEGTGLGLNISHNIIVQKHYGKISVLSNPNETCFKVKLPQQLKEVQLKTKQLKY